MDGVEIDETETDIAAGIPNSQSLCPIANACRRVFDGVYVRVDPGMHAYVVVGAEDYDLPKQANIAALVFDQTGKMEPFKFTLPVRT